MSARPGGGRFYLGIGLPNAPPGHGLMYVDIDQSADGGFRIYVS
jgi:hypothetical protein